MLQREVKKLERAGSLVRAQERIENDPDLKSKLETAHHSIPALRAHMIPQEWIAKLRTAKPEELEAVCSCSPNHLVTPSIIVSCHHVNLSQLVFFSSQKNPVR
mmetsp:Transcript_15382/g.33253  ORF Transcript_15382/g.33253 Transcript_15382/m.33253 type:complete len:103 (-) Transcript_15382:427-735(-)